MMAESGIEVLSKEALEQPLQAASRLSYNNAAHIYDAAGITPDPRFGGTCLHKLHALAESLPRDLKASAKVIMSNVKNGDVTHYALTVDAEGSTYYLDPFLWQSKPMKVDSNPGTRVETLERMWSLRRDTDKEGALLTVSFMEGRDKQLIQHEFIARFRALPNPAALPLKTEAPYFIMQIPDPENQKFYKLWYYKSGHLGDIWIVDGETGERRKVGDRQSDKELRESTISEIEGLLGCTREELYRYFDRARELEVALKEQMSGLSHDEPGTQHENI